MDPTHLGFAYASLLHSCHPAGQASIAHPSPAKSSHLRSAHMVSLITCLYRKLDINLSARLRLASHSLLLYTELITKSYAQVRSRTVSADLHIQPRRIQYSQHWRAQQLQCRKRHRTAHRWTNDRSTSLSPDHDRLDRVLRTGGGVPARVCEQSGCRLRLCHRFRLGR